MAGKLLDRPLTTQIHYELVAGRRQCEKARNGASASFYDSVGTGSTGQAGTSEAYRSV